MPLTKTFSKDKSKCKVVFSLPVDNAEGAKKLFLAGEFNEWNPTALPMRKAKGQFTTTLTLPAATPYQYRYVTETGVWLNDTEADCYVYSAFADADNSVVVL
ncbi:MAG: isoamylase early set domain-containing protein [Humidesulfovibrio sp.]|uniref:isoamylase early set domain-containing protein n=1 Tax=Humidesulfovibrio sp. TaxID=2910988 RepID=UPI0027FB0A06|nr:isoamylase early set domain-containing protein [Humidesulfovibrio sp.]MDQ7835168.1 isoamylase early set domain-containing protein [Humidesulfovibrio sp.]